MTDGPVRFIHHLEDRTRAQCHPLAELALLVGIDPGFAVVDILIPPATQLILLPEEPCNGGLETRVFREAEFTQDRQILEDIGNVA